MVVVVMASLPSPRIFPRLLVLGQVSCLIFIVDHTQFGCVLEHQLYQAFCGLRCRCIAEEIF